jgi:SAM-dependent methyltransferase
MNPFRYHAIVEADHDIQNPLSPEKLQRLIGYLRLNAGERVLDVGCGKGYLLAAIAAQVAVEAVGLDLIPAFGEVAQRRLAQTRLLGRAEVLIGPALDYPLARGDFQVALCIGATFALGGLDGTLERLAATVGPAGRIAVGEPFLRPGAPTAVRERWPEYDRGLGEIIAALAAHDLTLTGLIASSEDDWDHYESQHWRAAAAWLRAHPDDPDAAWLAERTSKSRRQYLSEEREAFGWAVFVAEKP